MVVTQSISFRNIEFSDYIHRPGIKKQTKGNTTFQKLDLFPSSGAGKNPILLGPLERASPNHWTSSVLHDATAGLCSSQYACIFS
jgi:hypothetical protein